MNDDDLIREELYRGMIIRILLDTDCPFNPRDDENLGVMICFHRRYALGDTHDLEFYQFTGWSHLRKHLVSKKKACLIYPLWLYDHSGLLIQVGEYTGPDARWDAGQVGFIYTTRERIRQEWGIKRITEEYLIKAKDALFAEVELYSAYLSGDVVGYEILDNCNGEVLDSRWGFIGCQDYCLEEARDAVDDINNPPQPDPPRPTRKLTIP